MTSGPSIDLWFGTVLYWWCPYTALLLFDIPDEGFSKTDVQDVII
jgi:hypothetical protein